jgi:NAD(P)-dependent dehydrogenase (short-subunit alcohol dehydrogenase family)
MQVGGGGGGVGGGGGGGGRGATYVGANANANVASNYGGYRGGAASVCSGRTMHSVISHIMRSRDTQSVQRVTPAMYDVRTKNSSSGGGGGGGGGGVAAATEQHYHARQQQRQQQQRKLGSNGRQPASTTGAGGGGAMMVRGMPHLPMPECDRAQHEVFESRIALVTGGTSGIGLYTAALLICRGAEAVVVCGRSADRWAVAQTEMISVLECLGHSASSATHAVQRRVHFFPCDVRIEENIRHLMRYVRQTFGRLDVVCNLIGGWAAGTASSEAAAAAGTVSGSSAAGPKAASAKRRQKGFEDTLRKQHAHGIYLCMKHAIALMRDGGGGGGQRGRLCIINMSSAYAPWGVRTSASTNGDGGDVVAALTRRTAQKVADYGLRIVCVQPRTVRTPLLERYRRKHGHLLPPCVMKRDAEAHEIAEVIAALADPRMSYVSGSSLAVQGGGAAQQ